MRVRFGVEGSLVVIMAEVPLLGRIQAARRWVREELPMLLRPWQRVERQLRAELAAKEAEIQRLAAQVESAQRCVDELVAALEAVEQGEQAAADVPAAEPEPQAQPDADPLATPEVREALRACLIEQEIDLMLYELSQIETVPAAVVEAEPGVYRRVGSGSTKDLWAPWLARVSGIRSGVTRAREVVEAAARRRSGPVWERLREEAIARLEGKRPRPGAAAAA